MDNHNTERFYGNDIETFYVNGFGQPFLVQGPDMQPGALFEEVDEAALDGLEDVTSLVAPGEFEDALTAIAQHVKDSIEADDARTA